MGLTNFTDQNDDDDTNGSGSNGGGGLPPMPPMSPLANKSQNNSWEDVEEMLLDYNDRFKGAAPTLFRDPVIAQTMSVLIRKNKPNPLLVGGAGVGKTKIAEDIARRIATKDASVPEKLRDLRVMELPLANLIAGAGIVGQLEARVTRIVDYARDPKTKVILFIDEIHQLMGKASDPIMDKVAQILKPALARGDMRVIGATTSQESRSFDKDPAFQRRFTRIIVDELTREQTVEVLLNVKDEYIAHYKHKVSIQDETLRQLATIADENSRADAHRPDNALTLLDQAMATTIVEHQHRLARATDPIVVQALQSLPVIVLSEDKIRSVATSIMTGNSKKQSFDEAATRAGFARLLGQEAITEDLMDVFAREDLAIFPRKKPLAMLFAGPSGVGKTEAVKIIAKEITGQAPIMLNMNEYTNKHDISKLIGAGPGYVGSDSQKELPFDTLESNPFRVILLDELEKADRAVHRLLLGALDEGWMRMADGKIVDFSKTILVGTTNAAREVGKKMPTGFQREATFSEVSQQEIVRALSEAFDPEFLGRFTKLVCFKHLTPEIFGRILQQSYATERERIITDHPRHAAALPAQISDVELHTWIERAYLPEQGARPAEQTARRIIEDALLVAQRASLAAAQQVAQYAAQINASNDEEPSVEDALA